MRQNGPQGKLEDKPTYGKILIILGKEPYFSVVSNTLPTRHFRIAPRVRNFGDVGVGVVELWPVRGQ